MRQTVERRKSRVESREPARRDLFCPRLSTLDSRLTRAPDAAWQRFKRIALAVISAWFLAVLLTLIVAWPVILKISRRATLPKSTIPTTSPTHNFAPPPPQHWFGTDLHGRDLFSRVLYRRANLAARRRRRRGA